MKDIITFLILLFFCMIVDDPKINTVFNESENQDIVKTYYLEINNLNTNNFEEYIKDLDVLTILPLINPVYEDKILKVFVYETIEKFTKKYINNLKQNGFYKEANKYILRPIRIKRISVFASLNEIYTTLDGLDYKIIDK